METKKETRADLTRRSGLILSISFTVSILFVITAFEWKHYDDQRVDLTERKWNSMEALMDIPVTEIKPPEPPIPHREFVPIPNDKKPDMDIPPVDIETTNELKIPEVAISIPLPEEETEIPFTAVEEPATPVGGRQAFYSYVAEKLKGKYPVQARRAEIEGIVFVEFIIERDGSLSDIKAVKGIGAGCDELAVKVVGSAPRWNPGKQRGKPVRQRYTLPIFFKLG